MWVLQCSLQRVFLVAIKPSLSVSRNSFDDAVRSDAPNSIIVGICDKDVPLRINSNSSRSIQPRFERGAGISRKASNTGPGESFNNTGSENSADLIVAGICDVEVAFHVKGDLGRVLKQR